MLSTLTVDLPMLVIRIFFGRLVVPTGWFPKPRLLGVNWMKVPVPVSVTVCGLPGALSLIEREALKKPLLVGLNLKVRVQFTRVQDRRAVVGLEKVS